LSQGDDRRGSYFRPERCHRGFDEEKPALEVRFWP
jgi:hypothetical protein